MNLSQYDGKHIRVTTVDGLVLEGEGSFCSPDYTEYLLGRAEKSLSLYGLDDTDFDPDVDYYQLFADDIVRIEWIVADVDDYIRQQRESVRPVLHAVRDTIRAQLPDAEERLSWQMPTYWKGRNLIHFAAQKNHVGIYPGPEAVEHFASALDERGYPHSKGAIRMPYDKVDLDFLATLAAFCGRE